MTALAIDTIIEQADSLPRLPDATTRLIAVINDPTSSFEQIVDVIRFDQTVTARILQVCNSAYYGLNERVSSLDSAARFLGAAKILQLVMAVHASPLLRPCQAGYGLPAGALWEHGVAVALAAQRLGRDRARGQAGTLFSSGLLHDMGKLLLNEHVGERYRVIAQRVRSEGVSFCEAEQDVLGTTHAEVGARLAERWRLPEDIVRVIRHHHAPAALTPPDTITDIVHVADCACSLIGIGGGDDSQMYRVDAAAAERCGLNAHSIEVLGAEVVAELKSFRESAGGT